MKRVILLALLALALPMMAWADSNIDISNFGGSLSVSTSGVTLSDSTVIKIGSTMGSNLGSVSLMTGALTGSLSSGGTFGDGTFTITGNGTGGFPSGVIFSGTFTDIAWAKVGTHNFVLTGTLDGTWFDGTHLSGGSSQLVFKGKTFELSSGDSSLAVPEPGTLGLLGTGLVGIAGLIRRKVGRGV